MDYYKKFLNSLPPVLDHVEQDKLLQKYFETKDEDVREKLLTHNLRICAKCASTFCRRIDKFQYEEEFFSVCYDQLSKSLDRFDPSKEVSFVHFALKNMELTLIRYLQDENHYNAYLTDTISTPDDGDSEESDMFYFIDDGSCLQDEVYSKIFKDDIIKCIDSLKGSDKKKEMVKMYLGLGYPKQYSKAEIANHFHCSREHASVAVSDKLSLIQDYIAKKYGNVFPESVERLKQNRVSFKNIEERNQYILKSYFNENESKSIGQLAKELGVTKGCVTDVIKQYNDKERQNKSKHVTKYNKSRYINQAEDIFNDLYGINSSTSLSKQELIKKYNLPIVASSYSCAIKKVEGILIAKGVYTVEQIAKIKEAHAEKNRQARLEMCKEIYHSSRGDEGYERKTLVYLAMEYNVAVTTIHSYIQYYKKHLEASNKKSEEQDESEK